MNDTPEQPLYERIYSAIRQIPAGRVSTYGRIAGLVGGCSARMVGYALAALKKNPRGAEVPWQRVINAQGRISIHGDFGNWLQRDLLEQEGVRFSPEGQVDLDQYVWPD